jgi:hypothetical protein
MFKWIENRYYWFLWFTGFADTDGNRATVNDLEKITFMLRRSKERMKLLWWVLSLGTLLGVFAACLLAELWWEKLIASVAEAILLWLFVHVLWVYTPPDNIWSK